MVQTASGVDPPEAVRISYSKSLQALCYNYLQLGKALNHVDRVLVVFYDLKLIRQPLYAKLTHGSADIF